MWRGVAAHGKCSREPNKKHFHKYIEIKYNIYEKMTNMEVTYCLYIDDGFIDSHQKQKTKLIFILTRFNYKGWHNFIITEHNLYCNAIKQNCPIVYSEDCTLYNNERTLNFDLIDKSQRQLDKVILIKKQLMIELREKFPKIIERKKRKRLHNDLFELFAHEANVGYTFEHLLMFDNWDVSRGEAASASVC